jgi:hypothetical protein
MRGGDVASLGASAFARRFCDRALRLAVAGLPPGEGASPLSFRSRELQGELAFFASASDCNFRLALVGHADLVDGAEFSPDSLLRVITGHGMGMRGCGT